MSIWFFEEQKHSLVLMEYLKRFRPDLAPTEKELHDVRFEFEPAPPLETLMLHFCGEIRLNHWYRRASRMAFSEPVIKHIYTTLSAGRSPPRRRLPALHEARHQQLRQRSQGRVHQGRRADGERPAHRPGAAPHQPARQQRPVPARHHPVAPARSRVAGGLARQADPVRRRVGEQGGRTHPAQPEPADGAQLRERPGAQPLPQGNDAEAGRRPRRRHRRSEPVPFSGCGRPFFGPAAPDFKPNRPQASVETWRFSY